MKKERVSRAYKFADSMLNITANNLHHFLVRDTADFAAYNVLPADMTTFRNEINAFEDVAGDIELEANQSEATEIKNIAAEKLRVAIREIMTKVELKYPRGSARYRKFGTIALSEMNDAELLKCGRRIVRVATEYLSDLTPKGVSTAIITALGALCQTFEDSIDKQSDAVANRDIATEDRIELGNALYKKLVDYCNIGKTIWITKDEAKYNDYVINNTHNGQPPIEELAKKSEVKVN